MRRLAAVAAAGAVAAAFLVGAVSSAAGPGPIKGGSLGPSSTTLAATWTSTSAGGTNISISDHGNVIAFESPVTPETYGHMGVEGYLLCYTNPATAETALAYDYGYTETGFGPATVTGTPPGSVVVTRDTADGLLRLKQTFSAYITTSRRSFSVRMDVTNLSTSDVPALRLRRQADMDVDSWGAHAWAQYKNWHATDGRWAAFAWNERDNDPRVQLGGPDKPAHYLALRSINRQPTLAGVVSIFDASCNASTSPVTDEAGRNSSFGPVFGDFADTIYYNSGTLRAGAVRTFIVDYTR